MFAFVTDKEKLCSRKYAIFALLSSLFGGFTVGMCSLFFASGKYKLTMWLSYITNPYTFLLNILPPILLSAIFFFICNRAVWSFAITNAIVMIPTLINYFKIAFRGDCFIFADIVLAKEAHQMLGNYKLFIDWRIIVYLLILAAGCTLLALFARGRFNIKVWYRLGIAVGIAAILGATTPLYLSDSIYKEKTASDVVTGNYSEAQTYMSKGFVYPFLHSIKDLFKAPPEGYNEKDAENILSKYEPTKDSVQSENTEDEIYVSGSIPNDKKVNIVCVMLEAYNDFSRFEELEFINNPYEKYRELEAMGYSGTLITDIHAGDTKISEREFLTGLPYAYIDSFGTASNSYVWYLRQNGYTTEGAHPITETFYDRKSINANLGFENYYFDENYFHGYGGITWDKKFFESLYDIYEARDETKPYFSFSVSYQGHGPYDAAVAQFKTPYVKSDHVSEADKNILNNYLNAQASTTEYLYGFATKMLAKDEPVVLVFFGDHKPWLGYNDVTYGAYGINVDTSTEEGFFNYFSTRYLILANDAAKKVTGNDFSGEGEKISPHFLMNKVFELCGYKGSAYMQYTSEIMKKAPVMHRAMTLPEEYKNVAYYYRKNFAY